MSRGYEQVIWCLDCNTRRLSSQRECVECLRCKEETATIAEMLNVKPEDIGIGRESYPCCEVDDFVPTNAAEVLVHIDDALGSLCRALVVAVEVDFCPIHNAISDLKRFQLSLRRRDG